MADPTPLPAGFLAGFPGLWVESATTPATLKTLSPAQLLPTGQLGADELLVEVACSSLNYKDALAVQAQAPVVRRPPLVPGIDLAGTVLASTSPLFRIGDAVISTGAGLGETVSGGFARYARVPAGLALSPPPGLSLARAMALGTAGLTAMLCVQALEEAGLPPGSPVVVSGATGGVGSVAVLLLAGAGHRVSAISGKPGAEGRLRALGAHEVLPRAVLLEHSERSLLAPRWAGAVDTVGGPLLAGLLRLLTEGGRCTACGMAGGGGLPTSVYPFILRGISLQGIACSLAPTAKKLTAWRRLVTSVDEPTLARLTITVGLAEVPELARRMLAGELTGRVVVELSR